MKSNVGYSTLESAFEAGVETAQKAMHGIKNPKVGMLYTSVDYNQKDVIKGVSSILGEIPVVGCTSSGAIIVPEGIITSDHGFAGMLLLDDENLIVGVAGSSLKNNDARETGRMVAIDALKNAGVDYAPSYYYMTASPKEEESYVKGIQDVIGDVPFFGGSAADNTISGDWSVFCNDDIFNDGVAVIFYFTDKPIETVFTGAYHETNNVGIITKIDKDRKLVEIDNAPALEKYAKWINKSVDELKGQNLLIASITNPLGVKDPLGDLIAVRHPMNGNEDNTINVGNKLAVNTAVIQLESTVDELIHSTGVVLNDLSDKLDDPAGYFLVHCGGRKVGIGDRIEEVHKQLVKASNGVPFITIFTFGEYGYNNHSRNTCGGLMLSFTGFEK